MEFNTQPTPGGGVPGDFPGKTKPSRPFIGDIPGEGSQGPTDHPTKEPCPHCGKHPTPLNTPPPNRVGDGDLPKYPEYRGEQQGRGGHFGSGHQKGPADLPDDVIPMQEWLGQTEPTHPNWDLPKFFSHPHAERKRANEGRVDEPHPEPFSPEGQRFNERMRRNVT